MRVCEQVDLVEKDYYGLVYIAKIQSFLARELINDQESNPCWDKRLTSRNGSILIFTTEYGIGIIRKPI